MEWPTKVALKLPQHWKPVRSIHFSKEKGARLIPVGTLAPDESKKIPKAGRELAWMLPLLCGTVLGDIECLIYEHFFRDRHVLVLGEESIPILPPLQCSPVRYRTSHQHRTAMEPCCARHPEPFDRGACHTVVNQNVKRRTTTTLPNEIKSGR